MEHAAQRGFNHCTVLLDDSDSLFLKENNNARNMIVLVGYHTWLIAHRMRMLRTTCMPGIAAVFGTFFLLLLRTLFLHDDDQALRIQSRALTWGLLGERVLCS